LESLLVSGVNDRDPSGNLMEAYQNYRHRACLEISSCHEEAGDREAALRYAVLARDRYPYPVLVRHLPDGLACRVEGADRAAGTGGRRRLTEACKFEQEDLLRQAVAGLTV